MRANLSNISNKLTTMPALLFILAGAVFSICQHRQTIRLEAEDGQLHGTSVAADRPGFSGTGYVTGFVQEGASVVLTFKAESGIYDAKIRYSTPNGEKGYVLKINGSEISGMLPFTGNAFGTTSAGKIELVSGQNTVEIERGWGYFDVDCIELVPSEVNRALLKPPAVPSDPNASQGARNLLKSLIDSYGSHTKSGQYGADDSNLVLKVSGQSPSIFGDDFIDYSPSRVAFGSMPKDLTERAIERAKRGQIVTMSWHWNAPIDLINKKLKDANGNEVDASWYKSFYTNATTFDLKQALEDPASERYRLLLRDIDAIAIQLKKFADAGIPVLWRPLHEAEGGWFWWGAKGPKPFVQLWRLLFDRLTNVHHLHNLIWVFTVGSNPAWYPGDAYVDILGVDAYPGDHSDSLSNTWESLKSQFDGKKLLALSEFGGVPDIPRMRRFGVEWSYFVSWVGTIQPPGTPTKDLVRIYSDKSVHNKN